MSLSKRIRLLFIVMWVGSLWTVGYLVAPTLFTTLADTALAGTIAGNLFRVEAWLSVVAALVLLSMISTAAIEKRARNAMLQLVSTMLICTLIGYFGLQPLMASLRGTSSGGVLSDGARMQFGLLHAAASALYLTQSILGIFLVIKHAQSGTGECV